MLTGSGWWGSASHTYDHNSNQLTATEDSYPATNTIASGSNHITSILISSTSYPVSYTSQGNISAMTPSPGNAYAFTYNKANELSEATLGSTSTTYFYDSSRKRFAKAVEGVTTLFFHDQQGNVISELTGIDGGSEVPTYSEYIWLGNRLIGTLAPATNTLAMVHVDKLGQPISATDANKYISQLFDYSPYLMTTTPYQQSGSATITQNQRSVGMYADAETGLNHNGFRDYSPLLGRYIESDPTGLGGGLNTYAYANGNPLNNTDRLGLDSLGVGAAATAGASVAQTVAANAAAQSSPYSASSLWNAFWNGSSGSWGFSQPMEIFAATVSLPFGGGDLLAAGGTGALGSVFIDGTTIERTYTVGSSTIGVLGDVSVNGSALTINNVAIYGYENAARPGIAAMRSTFNSFATEAQQAGFNTLTVSGLRYSGAGVGRVQSITRTLLPKP